MSGIIGKKIAATLASTGTPSFFIHPGEAYHGDLGMISKNKFQKLTNLIFTPLDRFLKLLIVVVSVWTPIDLSSYVLQNIQEGILISGISLFAIFICSKLIINLSKIDISNAKTLQIEALCQNFPIVLGIALSLNLPEVAIYGVIYYLVSMVFAVS